MKEQEALVWELVGKLTALQISKVLAGTLAAACFLAWTPSSVLVNFVLLLAGLLGVRCWIASDPTAIPQPREKKLFRRLRDIKQLIDDTADPPGHETTPPHASRVQDPCDSHNRWRDFVGSKVVESSWETLCGSIVQEFIYDTWYAYLTPDREFPAEIRHILNHAFGQLAARGRGIDLRAVMHDVSELIMEQIELYRDTREALLSDSNSSAGRDFLSNDPKAQERALRERLTADGNLHPALTEPQGDYKMLKAVADGLASKLLRPSDYERTTARTVARELLAGCVLRPLMLWCTPYSVNKAVYRALEGSQAKHRPPAPGPSQEARTSALRGHWEFERRLLQTVAAEAEIIRQTNKMNKRSDPACCMPPPQPRRATRHSRSRSYDEIMIGRDEETVITTRNGSDDGIIAASRFWSESTPLPAFRGDLGLASGGNGSETSLSSPDSPTVKFSRAAPAESISQNALNVGPGQGAVAPPTPLKAVSSGGPSVVASAGETVERRAPSLSTDEHSFSSPRRPVHGESNGRGEVDGHFVAPLPLGGIDAVQPARASKTSFPHREGFIGMPVARVVAADLITSGAKDFVVYKIRVGDGSSHEWTVSRRYRHFEVLHRQLRSSPGYQFKLPPKRIFIHTQTVDFVEYRRQGLDSYLRSVLMIPTLSASEHTWEFLKPGSERFEDVKQEGVGQKSLSRRGLSRTVLAVTESFGRGVVGGALDVTQVVTHGVKQGVTEVGAAVGGGVGAVLNEARSGFGLRHRRSASTSDLDAFGAHREGGGQSCSDARVATDRPAHLPTTSSLNFRRPDVALAKASTGFLRSATKGARKMRAALVAPLDGSILHNDLIGRNNTFPASSTNLDDDGRDGARSRSQSPMKRLRQPHRPPRSRSRQASPLKLRRGETVPAGIAQRTVAFYPANHAPGSGSDAGSFTMELDLSGLSDVLPPPMAVQEVDAFGASSPSYVESPATAAAAAAFEGSRQQQRQQMEGGKTASTMDNASSGFSVDLETYGGISGPLYEMVDCLFQLQTRGFFRRQVYAVARQVLSIAMGDAIDVFLLAKLQLLRQETTIARIIQLLQSSLWPGGLWFQNTATYLAARPDVAEGRTSAAAHARACAAVSPESYLEAAGPPPLDEEEIKQAVAEMLLRRAPSALVRLVGRGPYSEGVQDLYEIMQSDAFMRQVGYGLLEIAVLHLYPELKGLFWRLEHGEL